MNDISIFSKDKLLNIRRGILWNNYFCRDFGSLKFFKFE